jgi:transcriptional regulator with XRE-family HTH domain
MKKMLTFGTFLHYKRKENGYTLRHVADELGITKMYLSELENNKKTNPSIEIMQGLISMYHLGEDEAALFYDLHAKANGIVSCDLTDYIMKKGVVLKAIRTAKKKNAPDADWREFTDRINKTKK